MDTVTITRSAAEKVLAEMQRYTAAYESYVNKGEFESLDTFLEFSAEVEVLKTVIITLQSAL